LKKRIWLIVGLISLVLLLSGAKVLYDRYSGEYEADNVAETDDTQTDEIAAPDFTVIDMDGSSVSLSDFKGKPVVVNFWASWCGPCKSEMPDFNEVYHEYGNDIVFMMVNMTDGGQETVSSAKEFLSTQPYDFPVYFDVNIEAAIAYSVTSIPTTYFIDADGNIGAYATGMLDYETIVTGIEMILE